MKVQTIAGGRPGPLFRAMAWLLCAAVAACGGADVPQVMDTTRLAARVCQEPGYRVIVLGQGEVTDKPAINARGQVAFSLSSATALSRAYFYDGATVRDLGTLGGPFAGASGLNDAGQVAGYAAYDATEHLHAFRWSVREGMVDLGAFPSTENSSSGLAINSRGQVAGASFFGVELGQLHAFLWDERHAMVDLGTLSGSSSVALDVNDGGALVGYSGNAAFIWTASTGMRDLGTIGGNSQTAKLINNKGQVAGDADTPSHTDVHAFVWTRRTGMVDIGTLGGTMSSVTAMNESGQIAGLSSTGGPGGGELHAMFWTGQHGMRDLGTLGGFFSLARAMNNKGQVVGQAQTRSSPDVEIYHAFLWSQSKGMVDLNARLIDAPKELELIDALAISDSGAIVGQTNTGLVLLKPHACGHR